MRCKILLTTNPFVTPTASSNRLSSLIIGLSTSGCKIELFIFNGYSTYIEKSNFGKQGKFNNVEYKYLNDSVYNNIWKLRFRKYITKPFFLIFAYLKLRSELQNFNDIVWVENDYELWRVINFFRKPSFKLFTDITEFPDITQISNGRWIHKLIEKRTTLFFYDNIVPKLSGMSLITKTLFDFYRDKVPQNKALLHLPMTVDLDRFSGEKKTLEGFVLPYIVFVGVMNDFKDGVSILINAFDSIKHKYSSYSLYLVGGWNYDTPEHQRLIREKNLQDRVFWMNEYPKDKIPSIICNADLLVLPRPDSKQARGGFPTKLGEYLATGNPVCATKVGELSDYLIDDESVYFAEPGSVKSFSEAMDRALKDYDKAKIVGRNGRNVAEMEFNKDIQAKRLYTFFSKLKVMI